MDLRRRRIQYLAAFSVSLASLTFGTSTSWPSPVIPKLLGNETSINLNENEVAWIIAMAPPGFITGGLMSRYLSDTIGRRNTVLISALPNAIGTIFIVFSNRVWYLYVTRFVWGVGAGIISSTIPMYIAEIADKEIRGTLTLCTRIMFNFGNLIIMSVGSFVSYELINYMMLVLPVCYFVACLWIPESPYYLLKEGKLDAARKAMTRLKGIDEKALEEQLELVQSHVKSEMRRATSLKELITGKQYRQALIIGLGLKFILIFSGTVTLTQYLGVIMQESGADVSLATVLIVYGALRFLASITSAFIVDKVNRRPLYMFSLLCSCLSCLIVAAYFFLQEVIHVDTGLLRTYGCIPFIGILAICVLSNFGYNAVTFVTLSEVFPLNIKAVAMTTVGITGGLLSFGNTLMFQVFKQHIGVYGCFVFFGFVCLCGTIFVYFNVPETKGKSLQEIQVLLQGEYYDNDIDEEVVTLKDKQDNHVNDVKMTVNDEE